MHVYSSSKQHYRRAVRLPQTVLSACSTVVYHAPHTQFGQHNCNVQRLTSIAAASALQRKSKHHAT
jgi:hypothetical protein